MLRAWLKRLDVNVLSARPHMNSPSYRDCQRRRALLAVELLENRLTPSHLTIFSATMPHGSAGSGVHANHGAATSAAKHITVAKVTHAADHSVTAKRASPAASVSKTTFTVSAPAAATAGKALNVIITAKNASGKTATSYSGNVALAASDGQVVHLVTARRFVKGVAIETIVLYTADTLTLTAAAGAIKGTSAGISVKPAAASVFAISAPTRAMAGTGFNVMLTAKDAYGNTVTGFSGNVNFASSDGQPLPVLGQTVWSNGAAIYAVVLNSPDTITLTAA
ncbi:MAG TPA: hypothetical protein VHS97_20765 [Isosphaeraceae bacterium]|nr:hypothetical protein [Isosphaeraceae bacterium]